jgi:hypothetical protein
MRPMRKWRVRNLELQFARAYAIFARQAGLRHCSLSLAVNGLACGSIWKKSF